MQGWGLVLVLGMNLGLPVASLFGRIIDFAVARLLETAVFSPIIASSRIAVFSGLMRSSSGSDSLSDSDSPIPITRILTIPIILTRITRINLILKTSRRILRLCMHFQ
jgi:hypothetical protein